MSSSESGSDSEASPRDGKKLRARDYVKITAKTTGKKTLASGIKGAIRGAAKGAATSGAGGPEAALAGAARGAARGGTRGAQTGAVKGLKASGQAIERKERMAQRVGRDEAMRRHRGTKCIMCAVATATGLCIDDTDGLALDAGFCSAACLDEYLA
jgi:hypothetical protein